MSFYRSLLYCVRLSYLLPHLRCACEERFSPAYSQRDFPESAFDLSTMLGGALSVHTVVGLLGKSNHHAVTYVERFSQMSEKTFSVLL